MDEQNRLLAAEFEAHRTHLRGVAYRMLGSLSEAEDAVQEAWLNVSRAGTSGVENLGGWLTRIVARVCLDMLRSRKAHPEEPWSGPEPVANSESVDPEQEAVLADSVGLALLVILETLAPAERLAFVLHDLFALPFEEIAGIVGRSPAAARQLASRARRRVQGAPAVSEGSLSGQREVVGAFLTALRGGDFEGLVAVLDPDVVVRTDIADAATGGQREVRGARNWAKGAITGARGARFAQLALVNGKVGIVVAPLGRLFRAIEFTLVEGKIAQIDVVTDPSALHQLDLALLRESN